MSNKAAVLKQASSPLVVENVQIPRLAPSELLIKNHAIAINPVDWKMRDHGAFIRDYPVILGSDVAGTIEAVGSDVNMFKEGDRVAGYADVLLSKDSRNGAFQQYTAVKESGVSKIPNSMSFEEASILPMAVATAGGGIFIDLEVPRPPVKQTEGFLVWGATSAVGSAAVQIARVLGFTVFAVNSPRHNDNIKSLGATYCADYSDPAVVQKVIDAAKSFGHQIKIGYDAISENGTSPLAAAILEGFGGGKLCMTLPYPDDQNKPSSVQTFHTFAMQVVSDQKEVGLWMFGEWLSKSLNDGTFVPTPAIKKVDGGIEGVQKALDLLKGGVSGEKLVLSLSDE